MADDEIQYPPGFGLKDVVAWGSTGLIVLDSASQTVIKTPFSPENDFLIRREQEICESPSLQELSKTILPTSHDHAPAAPNFFLEAKPPSNGTDVAKRQACLDGALGARAMHSLQNYGEDKPIYDGNAYTYSSIYHSGQLVLYAHHITGPTAEGERAEYHMTQLKGFLLTGDRETFIRGATAVRNARDYARQQRNMLIQKANARVPHSAQVSVEEHSSEVRNGSSLHPHVCHWETKPSWQDSHDNLQQKIAETYAEVYEDSGSNTPTHQYNSDESQDLDRLPAASRINDPCKSFVSSLTSNGHGTIKTCPTII